MTEQPIDRLLAIMARLRDPDGGCPWDVEQDFASIAPYTVEEAYEVADAIAREDFDDLKSELGDLLLQVVFHARMAEEADRFDFHQVAGTIADKMVERHPHVFGDGDARTPEGVKVTWEQIKADERSRRATKLGREHSVLDEIPLALPALLRAEKLQKRAARVGFDWGDARPVLDKITEETAELRAEMDAGASTDRLEDELGDLLFVIVNLARHLKVDAETALRRTNHKFERRFRHIEDRLARAGMAIEDASLDQMEDLWTEAKRLERSAPDEAAE